MIKIKVFTPSHTNDADYYGTIIPVIGDKISISGIYFKVVERTLFADSPHYMIIRVENN